MNPRLRLVLPHTVLLLISVLLYAAASRIETQTGTGRLGPDFWPKLVIGAMAALCIYEIVKRLVFSVASTATGLTQGLNRPPDPDDVEIASRELPQHHGKLLLGTALVLGFVLAVAWLGFFVATALFLALFSWIGGFRRPAAVLAISIAGGLALLVIFMRVAYVSLPLGEGVFKTLSLALLKLLGVQ